MGPKYQRDGTWVYTPIGVDLAMVGLEEIGVYIACRQNKVVQYLAARPIMDLCLLAERKPGLRLSRILWEHPAQDILGIRTGHAAAGGRLGDGDIIIGGRGRGRVSKGRMKEGD